MFQRSVLAALLSSAVMSSLVAAACTDPTRTVELCCETLNPYSSNAYVYENICGIEESDQSVLMGGMCTESSSGCSSFHGWYDACCVSADACGSGIDGPIGVDCTGTRIE